MAIRLRNMNEVPLQMADKTGGAGAQLHMDFAGGDVTLTPRMPWGCYIAAALIMIDTDPDANGLDFNILNEAAVVITDVVTVLSTAGDGTVHVSPRALPRIWVDPGEELTLNLVDNGGVVGTCDGSVILITQQPEFYDLWQ